MSTESADVYKNMGYFISLLDDENSYVRNRVLVLIAENARWDSENKINSAIEKYLFHITDKKPITARQCIKSLAKIVLAKPELKEKTVSALKNADVSCYAESMCPLVEKDISETLLKIEGETPEA